MNSLQFKKSQLKYLCSILGCKPTEIEYILANIDKYYHGWVENKTDKITGELKKFKDGTIKQRSIQPSLMRLKSIQNVLKSKILAKIELPPNVHGGVKTKSNITNAKPHKGNKFQFTTDLQDFYPGISHKQVYSAFLKLGYSDHFAYWVTRLTTWKYALPQGTPTSTHVANIVFLETDKKIIELCSKHGITYTRYIDDLTFSSQQNFEHIIGTILEIIIADGFKVSYRKTRFKGFQKITGIKVFNNFIDIPIELKERVKIEAASKDPSKPLTNYRDRIRKTNTGIPDHYYKD